MGEETGEGEEQDEEGEEYKARKEVRAHTPLLYPTKIKSEALSFAQVSVGCTGAAMFMCVINESFLFLTLIPSSGVAVEAKA